MTLYQYNNLGEMTNLVYNSDQATAIRYTYDRLGRQKHIADPLTARTFIYDPATIGSLFTHRPNPGE
jgi:hypothetical protein